ncbi:MAG: YtxH domain-containing protein [Syntrophothermus sp.]
MAKFVWGMVAGLTAGAVLGLLFAPKKGSTLRRRISQGTMDVAEDIKDKFSDFMDGLLGKIEKNGEEFTMAEPGETNDQG